MLLGRIRDLLLLPGGRTPDAGAGGEVKAAAAAAAAAVGVDEVPAVVYVVRTDDRMSVVQQNAATDRVYGRLDAPPFALTPEQRAEVHEAVCVRGAAWDGVLRCGETKQCVVCVGPTTDCAEGRMVVVQMDVSDLLDTNRALLHMMGDTLRLLRHVFPMHFLRRQQSMLVDSDAWHSERTTQEPGAFDNMAVSHPDAVLMFADIVGFSAYCRDRPPAEVMTHLTALYNRFDDAMESRRTLVKYEIVGDCYVVAGGIGMRDASGFLNIDVMDEDAERVAVNDMVRLAADMEASAGEMGVRLRIGIHRGPATSGIVCTRSPKFVLCGDTVNLASRMQSTCPAGCAQMTDAVHEYLQNDESAVWHRVDGLAVKGFGLMNTWVRQSSGHNATSPRAGGAHGGRV
jgi:class 3 adenylate cyclase